MAVPAGKATAIGRQADAGVIRPLAAEVKTEKLTG